MKLTMLSKTLRIKSMEESQTHRNYCCSYPCRIHLQSQQKNILIAVILNKFNLEK